MGTNFYWNNKAGNSPDRDSMDPDIHIGKRSAAGHYCWTCKVTLCKQGQDGIHEDRSAWFDRCPNCGAKPDIKGTPTATAVELGFQKPRSNKAKGVHSCSSFTYTQTPESVVARLKAMRPRCYPIIDEYGCKYTKTEFLDMLKNNCPVIFLEIGQWFS